MLRTFRASSFPACFFPTFTVWKEKRESRIEAEVPIILLELSGEYVPYIEGLRSQRSFGEADPASKGYESPLDVGVFHGGFLFVEIASFYARLKSYGTI